MENLYLKTVNVNIVIDPDINRTIKILIPVSLEPYYMYNLRWSRRLIDVCGIIKSIHIKDGKNIYECLFEGKIDIKFGQKIDLEWPNASFFKIAKPTNIIGISFCVDELPKDLDKYVKYLLSGNTGTHSIKILYNQKGYYIEGDTNE